MVSPFPILFSACLWNHTERIKNVYIWSQEVTTLKLIRCSQRKETRIMHEVLHPPFRTPFGCSPELLALLKTQCENQIYWSLLCCHGALQRHLFFCYKNKVNNTTYNCPFFLLQENWSEFYYFLNCFCASRRRINCPYNFVHHYHAATSCDL